MTRILFVDDEPRVLEGLRLSLRTKRKIWQMVFVESGAEALAELTREPADVVVSDMRMPRMDGAELLAKVQRQCPGALRIVLSGQMDDDAASRAASVAHRFLAKPCDSATLEATITRALELNARLRSDELRRCIGGLDGLPSLPQTYLELTETLALPGASIRDVAAVIEKDMGMSAKVLQLVNSAFFGLSRRVVSVQDAVNYLGVGTMKALVLANAVFRDSGPGDAAKMERQQRHALLSAKCAKSLLRGSRNSDVAFTAALLHDVGALILESRLPGECDENRRYAREHQVPLFQAEKERLGVTHAEVGACLLGLWGLPFEVIEAVVQHHAPLSDFVALDVGCAVRLAAALVPDSDPDGVDSGDADVDQAADRLSIGPAVEALRAELLQLSTGAAGCAS